MKKLVWFYISLTFITCGRVEKTNERDGKPSSTKINTVEIDSSKFSIIPLDSLGHQVFENAQQTTLSIEDLRELHKILNKCVRERNIRQKLDEISSRNSENNLIIKKSEIQLNKYKCQYVPIVNSNNEKEVWVNCFCGDWGKNDRTNLVIVQDGGSCYFNLKINLSTRMCYDFYVNGVA